MEKNLHMSMLLDFYGELLTPKQAETMEMYYNQDLSLAEIAAETGVSRQGAHAFIKQGEAHLAEFEEKLGMAGRFAAISRLVSEIEAISDDDAVNEKIKKIKQQL